MSQQASNWVFHKTYTEANQVFERQLGVTELGFYWDTVCDRTADTLQDLSLECTAEDLKLLLDPHRIHTIWTHLKERFPLLAARIETRDTIVYFTVASHDIYHDRPGEITWKKIDSASQAKHIADQLNRTQHHLSNDLLAAIFVLERTDANDAFHVIFQVSHCITDGMANGSLVRTFLDLLCTFPPPEKPFQLQQQLSLSVASEGLFPTLRYNLPRRRWRTAIAKVILQKRAKKSAKMGGHTLPRNITTITGVTPADSRNVVHTFPVPITTKIMQTCRNNRITFGNAFPVIGQIAITRLLLRKYLEGEIDQKEWEFRQREFMISGGPINLRPFLDGDWLKQGGMDNVSLAISFYVYSLPFMPLGRARDIKPGMPIPSFGDLLSSPRFFHRCNVVKKQADSLIKHPLFIELGAEGSPRSIERMRSAAEQWQKYQTNKTPVEEVVLNPQEQASRGIVFSTGGSSMGNVDLLVPRRYPLQSHSRTNQTRVPKLYLKENTTLLRCRPGELYLGAATSESQLRFNCFWDGNVYDEGVIQELVQEVQGAVTFYLGTEGEGVSSIKAHL